MWSDTQKVTRYETCACPLCHIHKILTKYVLLGLIYLDTSSPHSHNFIDIQTAFIPICQCNSIMTV